jgi:hypothetical protein
MTKPGDDIKYEPLYQALAALGTKHQSMKLAVLKRYTVILKAPEVRRRAGRKTSFDQLAAAAHAAIIAAIDEMGNARIKEAAEATMCTSPKYEGSKVGQRICRLEKSYSDLDREGFKYARLVVLKRIYHYLTREPSPDNDWLASGYSQGWPMHPAGWEVAPALLPTLGRLRFRIAQLHYGALGTTFVTRFNDRVLAERYYDLRLLSNRDDRFPAGGDLFFEPCARFAVARDEFENKFAAWRTTYTTLWQETRLGSQLDRLEVFQPPIREAAAAWGAMSAEQRESKADTLVSLGTFYREQWFRWLMRVTPRYATSGYDSLAGTAFQSWELLHTLRDLFGEDPNPRQSARMEMEELLVAYYAQLSRAISIDKKPIRTVISEYFAQRGTKPIDEQHVVWHQLTLGSGPPSQ